MQRTNEEELELFADMLEPLAEILTDNAVKDAYFKDGRPIAVIKTAIKKHSRAVIELLALFEGVPVEEFHVSAIALPVKLLRFVSQPEIQDLFTSLGQMSDAAPFGSAMENTEDGAN